MGKDRLNAYDKQDKIGLLISFAIITVCLVSAVVFILTGYTVPDADLSGDTSFQMIRKTFMIKGVIAYSEFDEEKVVITYLESADALIQEFISYLGDAYTAEDGDGILILRYPTPASSQEDLQIQYDYLALQVSSFNELPDSEVLAGAV